MSSKFSTGLNLLVLLLVSQSGIERVWTHAYPVVSLPLDGAVLKEPREVRIQFTEGLELAFRQIVVKGLTARSSVRENCASWRMIQWRSI
jgi:methionine-rich copper-binding protein CopC